MRESYDRALLSAARTEARIEGLQRGILLLREATLGLQLAQGRYDLGLASVVELTQSQLNVTNAEIENLNAKYDYQMQYAALQFTIGLVR